jgi:hypothetical protein
MTCSHIRELIQLTVRETAMRGRNGEALTSRDDLSFDNPVNTQRRHDVPFGCKRKANLRARW